MSSTVPPTPSLTHSRTQKSGSRKQFLESLWSDEDLTEEESEEDRRFHDFFVHSLMNPRAQRRSLDEPVSRRIQVGLYPADAALLEEIIAQSKAAGLKNVSRARVLRVALRHFHTCWLNADS